MRRAIRLLTGAILLVVLFSACSGEARVGTLTITNDTNAQLTLTIVHDGIEDGTVEITEAVAALDSYTLEVNFRLFDDARSVTVVATGLYKAEEEFVREVRVDEDSPLFHIGADRGAVNFQNNSSNGKTAMAVWLVPAPPSTYNTGVFSTTRPAVEAAAVAVGEDLPLGSSQIVPSAYGIFYLIWEDSGNLWWYGDDRTFVIPLGETGEAPF